MKKKVIIDTDTGIDDAMGCVLALQSPELDILGLTSVFGNVDVESTTRNTAALLEACHRTEVGLAKGAARGFVGKPHFNPEIHGDDGVGNANFPTPTLAAMDVTAAQFIIDMARKYPGEVTFIGLGPLTNVALAFLLEPDLPNLLPNIVWMGGAVYMPGNVTPVAEADAAHDPESAEMVLTESGWKVTMVSLDVTDNTLFRAEDMARLDMAETPTAKYLQKIIPFYMDFYSPILGERACAMHSALTIGVVAKPELILKTEHLPMCVELNGTATRGMTVADRRPGRTTSDNRNWMKSRDVCLVRDVDRKVFVELFLDRVMQ